MFRRTKIVCTLGPATDQPGILENLIKAGVNVVRLNFSHGLTEDHIKRAEQVRFYAEKLGTTVSILGDLQGPKIRISKFKEGFAILVEGSKFTLDADLDVNEGNLKSVGLDYKNLPKECKPKDRLLLDDGRIVLVINRILDNKIECTVEVGGKLSDNKGLNLEGGGLSAPALTNKDKKDIEIAVKIGVDYLAVSFPRNAEDIETARKLLQKAGSKAGIVAKVERAEAVQNHDVLDDIIRVSEVVMVARGDLGVEIGDAQLMAHQKYILRRCRQLSTCSITATQMMESMILSPIPTRAEVFDVANAVLDGTDAVMLSAETATGDYPVESVKAMHRIIMGAEEHTSNQEAEFYPVKKVNSVDESIATAAINVANSLSSVKAIVSLTETGKTTLIMSRINSHIPIHAFSRHLSTQTKVALYKGVEPAAFDPSGMSNAEVTLNVIKKLKQEKKIEEGDEIIVTKGVANHLVGGTSILKVTQA